MRDPKQQWMSVTPQMAAAWLAVCNYGNRPISKPQLDFLIWHIQNGKFRQQGDPIRFTGPGPGQGRLLDGQTRLTAIVKTGVTLRILVMWDVEDSCFLTMDHGKPRTGGDTLYTGGLKTFASKRDSIAAAINWVLCYENGDILGRYNKRRIPEQLYDTIKARPDLEEALTVKPLYDLIKRKWLSPSMYLALRYLFIKSGAPAEEVDRFWSLLADRVESGLKKNHPITTLRERLIDNRAALAKLPSPTIFVFVVKAWNAYVMGQEMRILRWMEKEELPEIVPWKNGKGESSESKIFINKVKALTEDLPEAPVE